MAKETKSDGVRTVLVAVDEVRLGGLSGSSMMGYLRVRAFRKADFERPAKNVGVVYRVVKGPVTLGEDGESELEVRTDERGEATVDLALAEPGYALIAVELKKNPQQRVFFETVTEGVVDRLSLYAPRGLDAPGVCEAEIVAVDWLGAPVSGAELIFEASRGIGITVAGEAEEAGEGRYRAKVELERSGCWTLVAQDDRTRTSVQECLSVDPGDAQRIRFVGEVDPRRAEPYDRVTLRARLEDAKGNALDPRRLGCRTLDGEPLRAVAVGEEAQVEVRAVGYTTVPILFEDRESAVSEEITVLFSAVWLSDPGPVFAGEPFANLLYLIPPPDRPADHATVEIELDPELVRFEALHPAADGGPRFTAETHVDGDLLTITLEGEHPVTAAEYPTGVPIGTLQWTCRGEGQFCFSAVARMSPSTPPWKQCPDQKKKDTRTVCLNVIYDAAKPAHKAVGTTIASTTESIVGSADNVSRCCPILDLKVSYETIGDILIKGAVGADGAVTTYTPPNGDFQKLFKALRGMPNTVIENDCINLVLVPINANALGLTLPGPPGDSVIDPTRSGTHTGKTGAHELTHALGLDGALGDLNDPTNLQHFQRPVGTKLTAEQCKKIQQTLGSYSG